MTLSPFMSMIPLFYASFLLLYLSVFTLPLSLHFALTDHTQNQKAKLLHCWQRCKPLPPKSVTLVRHVNCVLYSTALCFPFCIFRSCLIRLSKSAFHQTSGTTTGTTPGGDRTLLPTRVSPAPIDQSTQARLTLPNVQKGFPTEDVASSSTGAPSLGRYQEDEIR